MEDLSQYELYDLFISLQGEAQTTTGLFLTVVSGYLAVAYLVGRSLSRFQATTVTGIFLVFTLAQCFGHFNTMMNLAALAPEIKAMSVSANSMPWWAFTFLAINLSIVAASLRFMWDIRRSDD